MSDDQSMKTNNEDTADTLPDSNSQYMTDVKSENITPSKLIDKMPISQLNGENIDYERIYAIKEQIASGTPTKQTEVIKPQPVRLECNKQAEDYSDFPEGTITHLTPNGIKFLLDNDKVLDKCDPKRELIVQIINLKEFPQRADKNIKMRLQLSDGYSFITAFFVNSPNEDSTCELKMQMIIKLMRPSTTKINDTTVLIMKRQPEIIYMYVDKIIGNPTKYEELKSKATPDRIEPSYIDKDIIRAHIKGGVKCQKALDSESYTPIKILNSYTLDWKIKARVLKKVKRSWQNMKGSGIIMTIDLVDNEGTQIQATFFNEAVFKFDNVLEENRVYTFAYGTVKPANKKFTSIANDYCISFEGSSKIVEVEDQGEISSQVFDFKNIKQILDLSENKSIDFIGIVHSANDIATINLKNGVKKEKRTLQMIDDSGMSISLSLWGDQATNPEYDKNPIIAFKCIRISNYGGKSKGVF